MAEDATNRRVLRALRGLHPIRVENPASPGTPDINYNGGWIENKHLPRWPRRGEPVKVDHFSPQQRAWHTQRAHSGGVSYVFLQVGKDYLLFRGSDAAAHLGLYTQDELLELALGYWYGGLDDAEFVECLVTE